MAQLNEHFKSGFIKTAQLPPVDIPSPITPANVGVWGARLGPMAGAMLPASLIAVVVRSLLRRKRKEEQTQVPTHVRLPFED